MAMKQRRLRLKKMAQGSRRWAQGQELTV
jgi:hypothetical protein